MFDMYFDGESARGLKRDLGGQREDGSVHLRLTLKACRANEQKAVALHGRPRLLELSIIRTGHPLGGRPPTTQRADDGAHGPARHHPKGKMSSGVPGTNDLIIRRKSPRRS